MDKNNPLLDISGFPRFNDIKPEHIEPALEYMLNRNRNQIEALIEAKIRPTWENFMRPLEEISDQLDRMWSPVSHLNSVMDSEELRAVYQVCLPRIAEYRAELGQNKKLFNRLREIRESTDFAGMDNARKKAVDLTLRDFKLSGVDLDLKAKTRYREICTALSDLCNRFSRNVLDATEAFYLQIENRVDLEGLPQTVISLAENKARQQGKSGWTFTLQEPSYVPFMAYCNSRSLRAKMYRAYVTRASDRGPHSRQWDNSEIICQILNLRKELSELLGFADYTHYSVETKMAETANEILTFLDDLADRSRASALKDLSELKLFATEHCGLGTLEPWDFAWASEQLRLEKFDVSEEALRPYFPLPKVLDGMFEIVSRLFGITINEIPAKHRWCPQVQFFEITNADEEVLGYFYIDLFARDHKRGGAWMAECIGRRQTGKSIQLPVAFLVCNFPEPVNGQPSLLIHDEVITLLHEFGHGLHHLLTRVEVASVAGINSVPWDAVELPSQFLENWCWQREALDLMSGHFETGASIPDDVLEKIRRAKNFQSGMQMLRQIEFSLFDLKVHLQSANTGTPESVHALLNQVREEVSVVNTPEFNRFENGFSHIFAGGYAAGYYSYKWAEVLSADAFSLFEENGLFDRDTGQSFLENILEKGGSEEPMDLFVKFRGRKPVVDALLRHSGLS